VLLSIPLTLGLIRPVADLRKCWRFEGITLFVEVYVETGVFIHWSLQVRVHRNWCELRDFLSANPPKGFLAKGPFNFHLMFLDDKPHQDLCISACSIFTRLHFLRSFFLQSLFCLFGYRLSLDVAYLWSV